jgi:transcription initiation factor TFIID subunit TAF12
MTFSRHGLAAAPALAADGASSMFSGLMSLQQQQKQQQQQQQQQEAASLKNMNRITSCAPLCFPTRRIPPATLL